MVKYLAEAFQKLSLLEEEVPMTDVDWKEKVKEYLKDDIPEEDDEDEVIIDPEAYKEEDLQDSYVGKVIIECNSCHTRLYKDQEQLGVNEEGLLEIEEECPVCNQIGSGWTVIGKIEPFDANQEFPEDGEPIEAGSADDVDFGGEEAPIEDEVPAEVNDDIPMEGEEIEDAPVEDEFSDEDEDEFGEAFRKAAKEVGAPKEEIINEGGEDDVCPECGKVSTDCQCAAQHKAKLERSGLAKGERELVKNEKIKESVEDLTEGCECGDEHCDGHCGHHHEHDHHEHEDDMDEACMKEGNQVMDRLRQKMMGAKTEACNEAAVDRSEDAEALEEELIEHGNENLEAKQDVADDDTKSLEDDQKDLVKDNIKEDLHIEASGEDKVDIKKNDDGSINLEVGSSFGEDFVGDPADDIGGAEMIAPIDVVQAAEIEAQPAINREDDEAAPAEDIPLDDIGGEEDLGDVAPIEDEAPVEDELAAEEENDLAALEGDEFNDFQEEGFDYLGEAYLRRVYENVNSFKTTDVKMTDGGLVVEGLIKFESGKEKATTFVFENLQKTKRGKYVFEGKNETFSNSNKAFTLRGNIADKKFVCETLYYNYTTKTLNESNESEVFKVQGKAVVKA